MRTKNLKHIINSEAKSFVPNDIDKIYASLGISLIKEEKVAKVEKVLKEEGKSFTPNKIERIYATIGIERTQENKFEEARIKDESGEFVPDVKSGVYTNINKVEPKPSFFSKLLKPLPLSITAAFLVSAIAVGSVMYSISKKPIQSGEEVGQGEEITNSSTLKSTSTVSLTVQSASKLYEPSVFYTVNNNGQVDNNSVIAINDDSANIVDNFESSRAITKGYTINEFTERYLKTALNLGYIERQDKTKTNKIQLSFTFDKSDSSYFANAKKDLENNIKKFMYDNKVIASFEIEEVSCSENVDSELDALIRMAYEFATKIFVDENGKPIEILCFSTNYDDWVEKYKDTSIEEMRKYVDFLKQIDALISDDEMKEVFVDALKICSDYQEAVKEIKVIYEHLQELHIQLVNEYNEKFHEHMPIELMPLDGHGHWDWWDDYGHDHPMGPHPGSRHGGPWHDHDWKDLDTYYEFVEQYRAETFTLVGTDEDSYLYLLDDIFYYASEFKEYYDIFTHELNDMFGGIMNSAEQGAFIDENKPPHGSHFVDMDEGWEDDFDDWWNEHYF